MELAPQVEDLAKAIQSLPSLLDAIFSLPTSGWIVLIAFFLWLLANKGFKPILDVLERREKRRIDQLEKYISTPGSSDKYTIEVVRDIIDSYHFKIATGIYAENKKRHALIKLHKSTSHQVSWRQINQAVSYIVVAEDESVTVRDLTWDESFGFWYNQFVGVLFLFFTAALVSLVFLSQSKTPSSIFIGFGGGILAALFAVFVFLQNMPIHASKKIAQELDKQKKSCR